MKKSDQELLAEIESAESQAYGFYSGELAQQRTDALDRYNCLPFGNEVDGRSQAVTTDLRDTVEWMMPQLLRIFVGGDEVVKFDPKGPEDEGGARQETEYVNHVILEKNNGFLLFNTWFRDALLQKNGYAKAWWEKKSDVILENYRGLTDDQIALLMQDDAVEPVAHTAYLAPDAVMGMAQVPMLHDVKLRRTRPLEYCRVECLPPEEVLVSKNARSTCVSDLDFIQHRTYKTLSELRQMGYKVADDLGQGDDTGALTTQERARNKYDEDTEADNAVNTANRRVLYRETYIRTDQDGDGIAELRKVCLVAKEVLHNEETDLIPIAALTPIISPHRHVGVSYYDLVKQIQIINTTIVRQYLDNLYLQNNGRYGVDVDKVNVDDMLVSRPGGIVRTKGNPAEGVMPLTHPQTGQAAIAGIELLQGWRENATGISAYYQGLNADALNKTATGISQIMTASQARVEAVARTFAETGVRELFQIVHAITLKESTQAEKVKLRNQWVTVDPREWVKRLNLTISVGLGSGSKQEKVAGLQMLLQVQQQAMQVGLATPENIYNTMVELVRELGYKNASKFVTDPSQSPPPQSGPPPEVAAAQVDAQAVIQKAQIDAQSRIQVEQVKAQTQPQQVAAEAAVRVREAEAKAAIDLQEARIRAQVDIEKAQIQAQTDLQIEAMRASMRPKQGPFDR